MRLEGFHPLIHTLVGGTDAMLCSIYTTTRTKGTGPMYPHPPKQVVFPICLGETRANAVQCSVLPAEVDRTHLRGITQSITSGRR